jgi:hypothetical protein
MVLTCEMCGASLDANKAINNIVTCEYCDSATNIHGYVHLNMSSDDRAATLMKRGFVLVEFKIWDKAKYVLEKAVDYDSKNAKAYLGLLMVDTKSAKEEELSLHNKKLSTYKNYHRAMEFADVELKARLESYNEKSMEVWRQDQLIKEEQRREKERLEQERKAKEQKRIEEEAEAAIKLKRRITVLAISAVFVIVVCVIIGLRVRAINLENERLALANFNNLTDLYFIVEFAGQNPEQRVINTSGLVRLSGDGITYSVEEDLIEAAGFSRISFYSWGIELKEVTTFAELTFTNRFSVNGIPDDLYGKYGVEVEVYEHGRKNTESSLMRQYRDGASPDESFFQRNSRRRALGNPCPEIVEIRFVKNDIPVVIQMNAEFSYDEDRIPGMPFWRSHRDWTITVGMRESLESNL